MRRIWKEKDIMKALKNMGKTPIEGPAYDRVWFKIEESLAKRQEGLLTHIVWRPWGHPIRWVAAAACLCLAFTGILYHQNSLDQADLAAYVETVSDPTANVTNDLGIVPVSSLMSEAPSSSVHDALFYDEDHADSLSNEELSL